MLSNLTNNELKLLIVGDYLFDPQVGLLSGPSGAHHMCFRMTALLSCLIECSNEVVDRDYLISELWKDDENAATSLNQCIGRLRQYFGDTAHAAKYIETIPNRGYRLVAPVYGSTTKPKSVRSFLNTPQPVTTPNRLASFILEFRDRKVCRSMLIYTIVIWLVFQVSEIIIPAVGLPLWANSLVVVLGILGFPVAAALSWIFDLTPNGLIREPARVTPSGSGSSRNRTDMVFDTMLVVAAVAIGGMLAISSLGYGTVSLADSGTSYTIEESPVIPTQTIAFRNFSRDGTDQLVTDVSTEVTAEILSKLIQRSEFNVLAGGALDGLANSQISDSRGVDIVLEGSVNRDGSKIQISVYLLDAQSEKYLWSQVKEQPVLNSRTLAEEVSSSVLQALMALENYQNNETRTQTQIAANPSTRRVKPLPRISG